MDLIAASIAGLLARCPVIPQAVGLDDQVQLWPEEIDAEAVDMGASLRRWEPRLADESQKSALELRVRQPENPALKDPNEHAYPSLAAHLAQRSPQPLWIDQIQTIRLVDGYFQLGWLQPTPEINQSAGRARHWDSQTNTAIKGGEPVTAMDSKAARAAPLFRRHRDLDGRALPRPQPQ
jgi:hypothetical protein